MRLISNALFAKWATAGSINLTDKRQIDSLIETKAQKAVSNFVSVPLFLSTISLNISMGDLDSPLLCSGVTQPDAVNCLQSR